MICDGRSSKLLQRNQRMSLCSIRNIIFLFSYLIILNYHFKFTLKSYYFYKMLIVITLYWNDNPKLSVLIQLITHNYNCFIRLNSLSYFCVKIHEQFNLEHNEHQLRNATAKRKKLICYCLEKNAFKKYLQFLHLNILFWLAFARA